MNNSSLYLAQRFASYIFDVVVVNVLYVCILLVLEALFVNNTAIQSGIKTFYSLSVSPASSVSSIILIEVGITFFILYGLYFFFMLLIWNKTLGMFLSGVRIVTPDKTGSPTNLNTMQKFSRGFFCGLLSFVFLLIIPLPFGEYNRSVVDYIAEDYVIAQKIGIYRKIFVWLISSFAAISIILAFGL